MRLDPDCIRDILIFLEDSLEPLLPEEYHQTDDPHVLPQYEWYSLAYHFKYCNACGLIECTVNDNASCIRVNDITPKGYEFLANIRPEKVWARSIKRMAKVMTISIPLIQEIVTQCRGILYPIKNVIWCLLND